jgi:hypothetical protein
MFRRTPNANEQGLEAAINKILAEMQTVGSQDPKYPAMLESLKELYKLKEVDYADKPKALSADAILTVAGSLAGILIIVGYEHGHVMASRALDRVLKTPLNR